MLCKSENPNEALYVLELGRARALTDLMSAQYSVKQQITVNPQSWVGIENLMRKDINCNCLYISYYDCYMFLWVLEASKPILFRRMDINGCFVYKGSEWDVGQVFKGGTFRNLYVLPHGNCEDRSLFHSDTTIRQSTQQDSLAVSRAGEGEEKENQSPIPSLAECYRMIIAPVANFLKEPEIVIAPDRLLYRVPFAALKDESDKYLSETFRIRIIPSLTVQKIFTVRLVH